jgi:hypothetical protein
MSEIKISLLGLLDLSVTALPSALTILSWTVACAILYSLMKAVFAIRSKAKVRDLLQSKARTDKRLRDYQERLLAHEQIEPDELASALKAVEETIAKLPDQERRVINKGLHQQNRAGAERFLKEVLGRREPVTNNGNL